MTKDELFKEFKKDYDLAVSYYNNADFDSFFKFIRPQFENLGKIVVIDVGGSGLFTDIENNTKFVDTNGNIVSQQFGRSVMGSVWLDVAKNTCHSFFSSAQPSPDDTLHKNNIDGGFSSLKGLYNVSSKYSCHSKTSQDVEYVTNKAKDCVYTLRSLFDELSIYLSEDVKELFESLDNPNDSIPEASNTLPSLISRDNAYVKLDEIAGYYRKQGGLKFIAILPENLKNSNGEKLKREFLNYFFRIHWSLIVDFNSNDQDSDSMYGSNDHKKCHIIDKNSQIITDGTDITNWLFANGQGKQSPVVPSNMNFKHVLSRMIKSGTTDNYVIMAFCNPTDSNSQPEPKIIAKLLAQLEDFDDFNNRFNTVIISKDNQYLEKVKEWTNLHPLMIDDDIIGFINHIKDKGPRPMKTDGERFLIHGRSIDITDDIAQFRAAGIEFFGPPIETKANHKNDWDFYAGAKITWKELQNACDVERVGYKKVERNIEKIVNNKQLNNCQLFTLAHEPGSGGTTFARRLGYDIYCEDAEEIINCTAIEIKSCSSPKLTAEYLSNLSERIDNTWILAIVEAQNVSRPDFEKIYEKTNQAGKRVLFFYIEHCFSAIENRPKHNYYQLKDELGPEEIERFADKYKSQGLEESRLLAAKSSRSVLEVIDFPLLLRENETSDTLSQYVSAWMNKLPENLKDFCAFVGFVGKYSMSGINQNLLKPLIKKDNKVFSTLRVSYKDEFETLSKLLIEECDQDKNPLGIWRPRYNRFSEFLLQAWDNGWKNRLAEMSKQFIDYCRESGDLGSEDQSMLHSIFIVRKEIDFRGSGAAGRETFSDLIKEIDDYDSRKIFEKLIDAYPDDSVFRGHFARFLYEKAHDQKVGSKDVLFLDAYNQLSIALEHSPKDADLLHMKGMFWRRKISALKRDFEKEKDFTSTHVKETEETLFEWEKYAAFSFEESILQDPSSPYGFAAQGHLIKETIEFGKMLKQSSTFEFCQTEEQYIEYSIKLRELLNQFWAVLQNNTSYRIEQSKSIYQDLRLFLCRIVQYDETSISNYLKKYRNSYQDEIQRSLYGNLYMTAVLNRGSNPMDSYQILTDSEAKEFIKILEEQRKRGDLSSFDKLFKLHLYGKHEYSIDDAIDLLKDCIKRNESLGQTGWGLLNACFYLAVCYCAKALQKDDQDETLRREAKEYFNKAREIAPSLNKGTIYPICYYDGTISDVHCIVNKPDTASLMKGLVKETDGHKGIVSLDCGLEASFNAKNYDRLSYEKHYIEGIIGFRYEGLGLYQHRMADFEPSDFENEDELLDSNNTSNEEMYFGDNNTPKNQEEPSGPKVGDIIEVTWEPKFKEHNLGGQDNTPKTYEGTYIKKEKRIFCEKLPYYNLIIKDKIPDDLYDGADVVFELVKRPRDNNPSLPHYSPINVRLKD